MSKRLRSLEDKVDQLAKQEKELKAQVNSSKDSNTPLYSLSEPPPPSSLPQAVPVKAPYPVQYQQPQAYQPPQTVPQQQVQMSNNTYAQQQYAPAPYPQQRVPYGAPGTTHLKWM
jgi:hypothetical protein